MNIFQVEAFNRKLAQWVTIGTGFSGGMSAARTAFRRYSAESSGFVRVVLLGAAEGSNVVYGSASENPVQAALDSASSER